jgi:hypothetical protein
MSKGEAFASPFLLREPLWPIEHTVTWSTQVDDPVFRAPVSPYSEAMSLPVRR